MKTFDRIGYAVLVLGAGAIGLSYGWDLVSRPELTGWRALLDALVFGVFCSMSAVAARSWLHDERTIRAANAVLLAALAELGEAKLRRAAESTAAGIRFDAVIGSLVEATDETRGLDVPDDAPDYVLLRHVCVEAGRGPTGMDLGCPRCVAIWRHYGYTDAQLVQYFPGQIVGPERAA